MNSKHFELMVKGYSLTTAEILYHMPDFPKLLQSYIWQEFDMAPDFPTLKKFLDFWDKQLDGKLHSVKIASCKVINPSDFSHTKGEFYLH